MNETKTSDLLAGPAGTTELAGKVILVTGGASGLGAALCQVMAASGANVMVGDLKQDKAFQIVDKIQSQRNAAHAIAFDVGDPVAAERAINETIERFGRLDVLINNAGIDATLPIEELAYEGWDRVVHTNLYGPFLLSKYAAPHMKQQGGG